MKDTSLGDGYVTGISARQAFGRGMTEGAYHLDEKVIPLFSYAAVATFFVTGVTMGGLRGGIVVATVTTAFAGLFSSVIGYGATRMLSSHYEQKREKDSYVFSERATSLHKKGKLMGFSLPLIITAAGMSACNVFALQAIPRIEEKNRQEHILKVEQTRPTEYVLTCEPHARAYLRDAFDATNPGKTNQEIIIPAGCRLQNNAQKPQAPELKR